MSLLHGLVRQRIRCSLPQTLPSLHVVTTANNDDERKPASRQFHSTSERRILPLLAVGVIGIGATYTYRALQQMDRDWEEYYELLEEYRAATGLDVEEGGSDQLKRDESVNLSSHFTGGTLAIDVGTSSLKISHLSSAGNNTSRQSKERPRPVVMVDREGSRSTPSLLWIAPNDDDNSGDVLFGRLAVARLHDVKGGKILRLHDALFSCDVGEQQLQQRSVREAIRLAASDALQQALGGGDKSRDRSSPVFVLDASMAFGGAYNVRPVFTYPPSPFPNSKLSPTDSTNTSESSLQRYKNIIQGLASPDAISTFVPEPVAIVAGAHSFNLLPRQQQPGDSSDDGAVLVVDVGGTTTSISIVSSGNLIYSTSLPLGAETFIDALVSHLIRQFYGHDNDLNDSNGNDMAAIPSIKPALDDSSALQRLYEASTTALHELSRKTRAQVNVPFLSIDLQSRQPRHLDIGIARSIIENQVESFVRNRLVPFLLANSTSSDIPFTVLSQSLPAPTDLSSLFSSSITSAMENSKQTPQTLRAILLVGGGSRIPIVQNAMKSAVGYLAGESFLGARRFVVPEDEMGGELAVLGAAVLGDNNRT